METLRDALVKINNCEGKVIHLNNTRAVYKLIKTLQQEKLVTISALNNDKVYVRKTQEASGFFPIHENLRVGRKQIKAVVRQYLPTISGHVLLTTTQGVMNHHTALEKGIGGMVIGIAY